jgi:plasmid replication initiation protein
MFFGGIMGKIFDYHNDLNSVPLKRFNEREIDLFFDILFYLKDSDDLQMNYNFDELKYLVKIRDKDRFSSYLENLVGHIGKLLYKEKKGSMLTIMPLFSKFVVDTKEEFVNIKLNSEFHYILIEATKNYTKIDLIEFKKLNSSYSKMLFKFLKQFASTGVFQIKILEFKEIFGIPIAYEMMQITQHILNPCMKELKPLFPGLKLTKIRKGRRIETLKFTFRKTKFVPSVAKNSKTFVPQQEEFSKEEKKESFECMKKIKEELKKTHHITKI